MKNKKPAIKGDSLSVYKLISESFLRHCGPRAAISSLKILGDCGFPYYNLTGQALPVMTAGSFETISKRALILIFKFNFSNNFVSKPLRTQGLILFKTKRAVL
jgi:hypothetical protein